MKVEEDVDVGLNSSDEGVGFTEIVLISKVRKGGTKAPLTSYLKNKNEKTNLYCRHHARYGNDNPPSSDERAAKYPSTLLSYSLDSILIRRVLFIVVSEVVS